MSWTRATYQIASVTGPRTVRGYAYRGLGITQEDGGSTKGRRKPRWGMSHLGTGHRIATLTGDLVTVEPIATQVAEAGDWTFDGLQGWRNQFPNAAEKVRAIIDRHPSTIAVGWGAGRSDEGQAQAIAMGRA